MSESRLPPGSTGLVLRGLDGANPLGFLAALGLVRTVALSRPIRVGWVASGGTWVPEIHADDGPRIGQDELIDLLDRNLARSIRDHPARFLEDLGDAQGAGDRRAVLRGSLDEHAATGPEWVAAFVSDFAPAEAINQLQTARRDYFFGNLTAVIGAATPDHLRGSLFRSWDYADPLDKQSLHLDPSEDRRHAHQWNRPSGDPDRRRFGGMLGANRLALEAFPLFTSLPEAGSLRTIGFTGNRSHNTRWTWPIWAPAIGLDVIRSILLAPVAQRETIDDADRATLRARGIVALYRTRRILVGKTPNFTPAERIA